jgi:hypothetical protein
MSIGIGSSWNDDNADYWREEACSLQAQLERIQKEQKNKLGTCYKTTARTKAGRLKIALHAYILLQAVDQIRIILSQKGVSPNWKNPLDDNLPFIITVVKIENLDVFRVFCEFGVDLNIRTLEGKVILDYVDDPDMIKEIISSRIDLKYIPKKFYAFQVPKK